MQSRAIAYSHCSSLERPLSSKALPSDPFQFTTVELSEVLLYHEGTMTRRKTSKKDELAALMVLELRAFVPSWLKRFSIRLRHGARYRKRVGR